MVTLILLALFLSQGCGSAGAAFSLTTHDNVIFAAGEAQKGVEAFNQTVIADTAARQEDMFSLLGGAIKRLALDTDEVTEEQAEELAQQVVNELRGHLANYTEQERRRAHLYEVTVDNLNYIIQISEQAKKYELYRADIGAQWREYLESSARHGISAIAE